MFSKKVSKMRMLRMCVRWKGVFQMISGLIILFFIGMCVYHLGCWGVNGIRYCYHAYIADDLYSICNYSERISYGFRFYENGQHGFIENTKSGKKVLRDVNWIAGLQQSEDSLLCYASNGYRGFLNRKTCQVVIPAKRYRKAWLFSEGVAAVMEEDSIIKFINPDGNIILDTRIKYAELPSCRGYMFKNGHCPMKGANGLWGLIDLNGQWTVQPGYDDIKFTLKNFWICSKQQKQGLLNDSLKLVVQPECREVLVTNSGIEILREDYTRQLLDYDGNILENSIYTDVRDLYYKINVVDPNIDEYEYELSPYKVYQTTYSSTSPIRVGLMGSDGKPITPPIYESIEAISSHIFRCFLTDSGNYHEGEAASVLINNKGQVIE